MAVSYTHLEVYKRQCVSRSHGWDILEQLPAMKSRKRGWTVLPRWWDMRRDVYKRQGYVDPVVSLVRNLINTGSSLDRSTNDQSTVHYFSLKKKMCIRDRVAESEILLYLPEKRCLDVMLLPVENLHSKWRIQELLR